MRMSEEMAKDDAVVLLRTLAWQTRNDPEPRYSTQACIVMSSMLYSAAAHLQPKELK